MSRGAEERRSRGVEEQGSRGAKVLRITLTKSPIGYSYRQKRTVRALGLRRMHQTVEQKDTPVIRGMVAKVRHLVAVEEIG
ncbi:MAG: 50S ribosomal protein L30 [Anaerolineae bacterium]|nr:50S ribosomal protein L30 [Anaerolineae bacterium]